MPCCTGFPEGSTVPGVTGTKGILVKNTGELFKSNNENVRNTQRRFTQSIFMCDLSNKTKVFLTYTAYTCYPTEFWLAF